MSSRRFIRAAVFAIVALWAVPRVLEAQSVEPPGGVPVAATTPSGAPTPIVVTFTAVSAPGVLTANVVANPPAAPSAFVFFLTLAYDVKTTASVTAPFEVCFSGWGYHQTDKLLQVENGAWVDRTSDAASSPTSKCGRMSELSTIVVVRQTATVVPSTGIAAVPPPIAINVAPGYQGNPRVSGDLVSYAEGFVPTLLHYYRFSTAVDAVVPPGGTFADYYGDVSGERIAFSRVLSDRNAITVFDASTGIVTEVDGHAASQREDGAIGGNTVTFFDYASGLPNVMAVDLTIGTVEEVSTDPAWEQRSNVSPNGQVIVWERCTTSLLNCDVRKSSRVSGRWSAVPVASSVDPEGDPDTDGTWIVYGANRTGSPTGADIHFQPVAGGPETVLAIAGFQKNPSISGGVIAFESGATATSPMDLFVYDIAANLLYQVTATPTINEFGNDISVVDNGDGRTVRIVWEVADVLGSEHDVFATTFSIGGGSSNQPPLLTLPANVTAEATGAAGASVTYSVTASDPEDGALIAACTPLSGSTFPLGSTTVTCAVADSGGMTATGTFSITVVDTKPPIVTAPAAIEVPATEAGGVRGSAWPALAAFLSGGSAVDAVDAVPLRLDPQVNGVDANDSTLFPIGTTTVTFRFRDASGTVGTRTSTVTVVLGTPTITARIVSSGAVARNQRFVDVELANTGTGNARQLEVSVILLTTTKGGGNSTLISPALPLTIGALDVNATATVRIVFDVPRSVKALAITEGGIFANVQGTPGVFLQTQRWTP